MLLERISLEGVCRAFKVSMPWLLEFVDELINQLPENLNAEIVAEDDEIGVVVLEAAVPALFSAVCATVR